MESQDCLLCLRNENIMYLLLYILKPTFSFRKDMYVQDIVLNILVFILRYKSGSLMTHIFFLTKTLIEKKMFLNP